ncbi:hypothetical protein [Enterobacter bugandensis]|uniref:hypothetical protein n=1 Tax=Enterobacter bugandensis TaxID=881260 RepID=UPI002FD12F66
MFSEKSLKRKRSPSSSSSHHSSEEEHLVESVDLQTEGFGGGRMSRAQAPDLSQSSQSSAHSAELGSRLDFSTFKTSGSLFDSIPGPSKFPGALFDSIPGPSKSPESLSDGIILAAAKKPISSSSFVEGLISGKIFDALLNVENTPEEKSVIQVLQNAFPEMMSIQANSFIGDRKIDKAPHADKLSPLEYASLKAYIVDGNYYLKINESKKNNSNIKIISKAISSALSKADKYNGITFRGVLGQTFLQKEGDVFISNFMSTSKSSKLVTNFMRKFRGVEVGKNIPHTRFVIVGSGGAVLSSSITEKMEEVLFPSGTEFNVIFRSQPECSSDPVLRVVLEEKGEDIQRGHVNRLIDALDLPYLNKRVMPSISRKP